MKKIILLSLITSSILLMTGCGCSKKEEKEQENVLICTYKDDEGNQSTLYFKNDYLIKQESKMIITFPDENLAKSYYDDMIIYGEDVKLDGNTVYTEYTYLYDSDDETYLKQNVITSIDKYDCK